MTDNMDDFFQRSSQDQMPDFNGYETTDDGDSGKAGQWIRNSGGWFHDDSGDDNDSRSLENPSRQDADKTPPDWTKLLTQNPNAGGDNDGILKVGGVSISNPAGDGIAGNINVSAPNPVPRQTALPATASANPLLSGGQTTATIAAPSAGDQAVLQPVADGRQYGKFQDKSGVYQQNRMLNIPAPLRWAGFDARDTTNYLPVSHTYTFTTNPDGTVAHTYSWGNGANLHGWNKDVPEDMRAARDAVESGHNTNRYSGAELIPHIENAYNSLNQKEKEHANFMLFNNCKYEADKLTDAATQMQKNEEFLRNEQQRRQQQMQTPR